jgi:hypothetical protein
MKMRLVMRGTPGGAPVSGATVDFALASGASLGSDTTDADGFAEYSQEGTPGPVLAVATYNGKTKYFDGRSLEQLGTIMVSDIPAMMRALGNGVIKGYTSPTVTVAGDLALSPGTGRKIAMAKGAILLDGHVYERSGTDQIDIAANSSGSTRYDRVIFRFVREGQTEEGAFTKVVLTGTSDSAGPALTNDATVKEWSIGLIRVVNGASSFVSGDITDERGSATLSQNYALSLPTGMASGDILYFDGGALNRLPKGTDGQFLTLASSLPSWSSITFGVVIQEGDVTTVANCSTLDFDASDFNTTESPSGEANISLAYGTSAGTPAEGNHLHTGVYANASHTHTLGSITDVTATAAQVNVLTGTTVTATELNYVHGVTSSIQTQLDSKGTGSGNVAGAASSVDSQVALFNSTTGKVIKASTLDATFVKSTSGVLAATTIAASDLPTLIDASKIGNGTVGNTEYNRLDGVTSSIQTQIDGKSATTHTHTSTGVVANHGENDYFSPINVTSSGVTVATCNLTLLNGVTYDVIVLADMQGNSPPTVGTYIRASARANGGSSTTGTKTATVSGERPITAMSVDVIVGTGAAVACDARASTDGGTGTINSAQVRAWATPRNVPAS